MNQKILNTSFNFFMKNAKTYLLSEFSQCASGMTFWYPKANLSFKLQLKGSSTSTYVLLSQGVHKLRKNVSLYYSLSQVIVIVGKPSESQSCCLLNSWDGIQKERPQKGHYT